MLFSNYATRLKPMPICLFGVVSLISLIGFTNVARAFPAECSNLTAPATFVESTLTVCLQKVKVTGGSATQYYRAALQWMGQANPNRYKLVEAEIDTIPSDENSPSYSTETGVLAIPQIDIPRTYGTERYSANLVVLQENNIALFELRSAAVYINPNYVPNKTWKPYGMLNPNKRRAVDLLGRSMLYAKLADAIYSFDTTSVDAWDLVEQESKDSGMQAGVYSNRETGELVLAFRGTEACDFPCSFDETKESVLDLAADALLTLGEDGPQFRHAFNFAQEMASRYQDQNIVVTGHSLGGGLAQAIGAALGLETFAFNSAPVPKDFFKNHPTELTPEQLDDTIHVIADIHDPVSNTDESGNLYLDAAHVSPLIQFDFDEKEILPDRLAELDALRFNKHGMDKLINNASALLTIYRDGW